MEYLVALLTTLALQLPAFTGQPIPDMASLPALEVADHLEQVVFAHTGQWAGAELATAAYVPRENLILITTGLLNDLPELEAVLVHELVHWRQVQGHPASAKGLQAWEEEARTSENRWRREHGLSPRSGMNGLVRHHP
jgi:Zn-dependent protease with chaperone function